MSQEDETKEAILREWKRLELTRMTMGIDVREGFEDEGSPLTFSGTLPLGVDTLKEAWGVLEPALDLSGHEGRTYSSVEQPELTSENFLRSAGETEYFSTDPLTDRFSAMEVCRPITGAVLDNDSETTKTQIEQVELIAVLQQGLAAVAIERGVGLRPREEAFLRKHAKALGVEASFDTRDRDFPELTPRGRGFTDRVR